MTPQNFSIPQGDMRDVVFTVDSDIPLMLAGATVPWQVYPQSAGVPNAASGVPNATVGPLIVKEGPGQVDVIESPSPGQIIVHLVTADTLPLSTGNYYHEMKVIDTNGNVYTAVRGIMTVTEQQITQPLPSGDSP
jgi:hypothetical protein